MTSPTEEPTSVEAGVSVPQLRFSVSLSGEAAIAIREIAERRGLSLTEVIRRALATHKYVDDAAKRGAKVLLEEPDKNIRELIFLL